MDSEVARLPDELVESIMRDAVGVVNSAARLVGIDGNILTVAREALESANFIHTTKHIDFQGSIVAVDGGRIASRLDNMDLLLVQAVGVEGIGVDSTVGWVKISRSTSRGVRRFPTERLTNLYRAVS